jgi:hypothetical protein
MGKFLIQKRVFEDYEAVVEAENEDEVYDLVANDEVEWQFIASDDDGLIIEEYNE